MENHSVGAGGRQTWQGNTDTEVLEHPRAMHLVPTGWAEGRGEGEALGSVRHPLGSSGAVVPQEGPTVQSRHHQPPPPSVQAYGPAPSTLSWRVQSPNGLKWTHPTFNPFSTGHFPLLIFITGKLTTPFLRIPNASQGWWSSLCSLISLLGMTVNSGCRCS